MKMTDKQAFEKWARENHSMRDVPWFQDSVDLADDLVDSWASWQAACAWQREQDRANIEELRENGDRLLAVADSAVQHQREMLEAAVKPWQDQVSSLQAQHSDDKRDLRKLEDENAELSERLNAQTARIINLQRDADNYRALYGNINKEKR
jgi:chromosome segregation ATPase